MRRNISHLRVVALFASLVLCGCAAMTGIPKGSTLLGVYEGSFSGKFDWGTIEFKLYQTPAGTKVFTGSFMEGAQLPADFRGQINNIRMEGSLEGPVDGVLSGELSADGVSMSGTYKINDPPFDHGTWSAQKK